jgi:hypothetical protein
MSTEREGEAETEREREREREREERDSREEGYEQRGRSAAERGEGP